MSLLAPTLQAWFTDRLITQRNSSPQTIAAYRDAFKLLLSYAHQRTGTEPFRLDFDDLDAPLIGAFLNHLEADRGNSARTRNARIAAIHSFYRYSALRHPEHLATIARVMAIPTKRHEHIIGVLPATSCSTRSEIRADVSCRLRSVLGARFSRKPYEAGVWSGGCAVGGTVSR